MAITVKFLADVVNFLGGLGDAEDAIGDNEAALEDLMEQAVKLGTAAGRTTDEIADDFSKAFGVPLDRAKRAVEEVTGTAKELGDAVADAGDKAGEAGADVASGIGDGVAAAGNSITELGGIARDVLSGDIGSAAEGAVSALGGIATAAGVGGAVGGAVISAITGLVSVMISELTKFSEQSKAVTEGVIQDFIDLGDGLDQAAVDKRIKGILADPDTRRQAELLKDLLGTDLPTALLALSGDFESAGLTVEEVMQAVADAPGNVRLDDWQSLQAQLTGVTDGLAAGPEYADAYSLALSRNAVAAAEAAVAAGDATKAVDEFGDIVYTLPDGKVVYVDAETGQATSDMQKVEDKVFKPKTVRVKVIADTSNWDNWTPQQKLAPVRAYFPKLKQDLTG